MKHLIFTFFLVILCLGHPDAQAQEQAQPAQATPSTSSQEKESGTQKSDDDTDSNESEADKESPPLIIDKDVSGKKISILSTTDEIADKANFWAMLQTIINGIGLAFVVAATAFAGLAWCAARKGVEVTRQAAKAEYRPYAKVSDITLYGVQETITFIDNKHCFLEGKIDVTNVGRTPIYTRSVSGTMTIIPRTIDAEHFNVSMGISRQEKEIPPNSTDTLTLFMSFNISEELGIEEADIDAFIFTVKTLVKFDDMFSISTPKFRYFRTEHNGIFTPVIEEGNNVYGPDDRLVHSLKLYRMDTYIEHEDIHETKKPENQPKQKTLSEFINEGNRATENDAES